MAWYSLKVENLPGAPTPRECHTIQVLDRSLIFFGGNDDRVRMNDTHIFDTESLRWCHCLPSGDASSVPSPRSAHSSVMLDGRYMLIFGGWDGNQEVGDLFSFDLVTREWRKVVTSGCQPAPRHFHSSVIVDRKMYVFGGFDGTRWRNDVAALDVDTMEWQTVVPEPFEPPSDGSPEPCGSEVEREPGPRASACAALVDKDKVFLFGGYDGQDFRNDMWILHTVDPATNLPRYRWEAVRSRTLPGGVPQVWPLPRSGHSCEVFDNFVLVFGGRYRQGRFNDTFIFNYNTRLWAKVTPVGDPFRARKTHAVGRIGSKIYLFGGHDGERWLGDLHVFDLQPLLLSLVPASTIPVPVATKGSALVDGLGEADSSAVQLLAAVKGIGAQADYVKVAGPPRIPKVIAQCLQTSWSGSAATCPMLTNSVTNAPEQLTMPDSCTSALLPAGFPGCVEAPNNGFGLSCDDGIGSKNWSSTRFAVHSVPEDYIDLSPGNYHNRSDAPQNLNRFLREIYDKRDTLRSAAISRAVDELSRAGRPAARSASADVMRGVDGSRKPVLAMASGRQRSMLAPALTDEELCDFNDDAALWDSWVGAEQTWPAPVVTDAKGYKENNTITASKTLRVAGGESWPLEGGGSMEMVHSLPQKANASSPPTSWGTQYTHAESFADIAFEIEGRLVHMHRAVLCGRSLYFQSMLTNSLSETRKLIVPMPDVTLDAFLIIAKYLYTSNLPTAKEMEEYCEDILYQAQKLQLVVLSLACQRFLESIFSVQNVLSYLVLADEVGARPLKRACLRFVVAHYSQISATMEYVHLRADLLRQILLAHLMARQKPSGCAIAEAASPVADAPVEQAAPAVSPPVRVASTSPATTPGATDAAARLGARSRWLLLTSDHTSPRLAGFAPRSRPRVEVASASSVLDGTPDPRVNFDSVLGTSSFFQLPVRSGVQDAIPVQRSFSEDTLHQAPKRTRNDLIRSRSDGAAQQSTPESLTAESPSSTEPLPKVARTQEGGDVHSSLRDCSHESIAVHLHTSSNASVVEEGDHDVEDRRQLELDEVELDEKDDSALLSSL